MSYLNNECDKCTESKMCPQCELEMLDSEMLRIMNRIEELKKEIECSNK